VVRVPYFDYYPYDYYPYGYPYGYGYGYGYPYGSGYGYDSGGYSGSYYDDQNATIPLTTISAAMIPLTTISAATILLTMIGTATVLTIGPPSQQKLPTPGQIGRAVITMDESTASSGRKHVTRWSVIRAPRTGAERKFDARHTAIVRHATSGG